MSKNLIFNCYKYLHLSRNILEMYVTNTLCLVLLMSVAQLTHCKNVFENDILRRKLPLEALTTRPNTNMVVSSLPLRFSLCKFASVANSETKKELMLALGLDSTSKIADCYKNFKDTITKLNEIDMIFLNKMYVGYTDSIDANFIKNSSEVFGVQVDKVGFNYPKYAASFINKWIDGASFKRITDIIGDNDINQDTSILLVNSIYLKVTWESPFDIRFTKDLRFHHFDRNISFIPMMTKTDSCLYFSDKTNNLQILNIKMGPSGTSITFVLPQTTDALPGLLTKINEEPNFLKNIKDLMRYTYIRITLPRFKIKTTLDWTNLMQQFVSKQIFNTTYSGLNGMLNNDSKTKNVYLSKVKQKNFILLDEMGSFRYVEGLRRPFSRITEPPHNPNQMDLIADKPFYFTVNLEPTLRDNYELFHGVFYGPE